MTTLPETTPSSQTINLVKPNPPALGVGRQSEGNPTISTDEYMQLLVPMLNHEFHSALCIANSLLSQYPGNTFILDYRDTLQARVSQDTEIDQLDDEVSGSGSMEEESEITSSSSACSLSSLSE